MSVRNGPITAEIFASHSAVCQSVRASVAMPNRAKTVEDSALATRGANTKPKKHFLTVISLSP